jgi:integrase/recombinase XerC
VEGNIAAYVRWMKDRGLSAQTVEKRVWLLSRLAEHVGKPLTQVTRADLDDWHASLAVLDSSRQRYISTVTCFYSWMIRDERLTSDPSRWLVSPRLARRMPRPIAEDDLELAIAAAAEPVRCWLVLAAYAGLRGGEVARLERGDVYDRTAPAMLMVRGKGKKERLVPASPLVLVALRPHLGTTGPLFRDQHGRPARPQQVARPCNDHLHGLGITETLHKLRSRFLSQLYRETGNNLRLTQDIAGHESPLTTAIYTAWSSSEAVRAIDEIGSLPRSAAAVTFDEARSTA